MTHWIAYMYAPMYTHALPNYSKTTITNPWQTQLFSSHRILSHSLLTWLFYETSLCLVGLSQRFAVIISSIIWLEHTTAVTYQQHIFPKKVLLLSYFSRVRLCSTPETAALQAPPSLGLSKQEHWSGLPFPSPMHWSKKWKGSCSVVSNS